MKKLFSLFAAALMAVGVMADPVVMTGTFNGKDATYTTGWSTTGTGAGRTDCIVIGNGENITSPSIDFANYDSISIAIKARRYGTLSGSKAVIVAAVGTDTLGTTEATGTSATAALPVFGHKLNSETSSAITFTCSNATSVGSSHGAGVNSIEITLFPKVTPPAPTTGWDGTAVFSLANMSSVADLEGITLTLNGATLALLDEDDFGGIYLLDEQGSNIYAICHPALGGNFAINGDVVTLTGWSTTDDYCVALPTESATLYFSDYGCFEIDGEAEYFADDDVAINYVAAAATTYTVTYSVSGIVADETAAQAGYYNLETEGAEFVAGANVVPENMIAYVYAQMIEGYTCEVLVNGAAVALTDGYWEAAITADMTIAVAFSEEQGEVSPYASVYTSNVAFTAGSNSYLTDKINIDGTEYDAFKIGTSKAGGNCSVTLPAGTEAFYFHAICWSKTADTNLDITGAYTETVVIKAANISGNSPYTFDLTYADPTERFYSHTFDAPLAAETTVTFTCGYRAVFFGVNVVGAGIATSLDNLDAAQAVKFIENGQVVILRDGVRYNAFGQVIE